mmetsp:Transcript_65026/g.146707  ORF Transcript_65026/g.146707 Transcript_65026/m.146707 type:complete len:249 (-) Transcript_65026:693-1439(-)
MDGRALRAPSLLQVRALPENRQFQGAGRNKRVRVPGGIQRLRRGGVAPISESSGVHAQLGQPRSSHSLRRPRHQPEGHHYHARQRAPAEAASDRGLRRVRSLVRAGGPGAGVRGGGPRARGPSRAPVRGPEGHRGAGDRRPRVPRTGRGAVGSSGPERGGGGGRPGGGGGGLEAKGAAHKLDVSTDVSRGPRRGGSAGRARGARRRRGAHLGVRHRVQGQVAEHASGGRRARGHGRRRKEQKGGRAPW